MTAVELAAYTPNLMSFWPFSNPLAANSHLQKFLDGVQLVLLVTADQLVSDPELAAEILNELHSVKLNLTLTSGLQFLADTTDDALVALSQPEPPAPRESEKRGAKLLEIIIQPTVLNGLVDYLVSSVGFFEEQRLKEEAKLAQLIAELPDKTQLQESDETEKEEQEEEEEDDPEPDPETEEDVFLRKLQVALDLLLIDLWVVLNRIIETLAMDKLWLILPMPELRESLPAVGHVVHILDQLMDANLIELLNFIRRQPDLVSTFLTKVDIPVLMDYFLRIIQTDKPDLPTGILETLLLQRLIPRVVDLLKPDPRQFEDGAEPDPDLYFRQLSATDFVKALVTISLNTALAVTMETNIGPNQLTRELVLPEIITTMVRDIMLYRPPQAAPGWTNKLGFSNCAGIIIEVIRKNNLDYDLNCGLYLSMLQNDGSSNGGAGEVNAYVMFQWLKDFEENPPGPRDPIYLGNMLEIFSNHLDDFHALMSQPPVPAPINVDDEVLGTTKFKISEVVAELLHCLNMILMNLVKIKDIMKIRDQWRTQQARRLATALSDTLPASDSSQKLSSVANVTNGMDDVLLEEAVPSDASLHREIAAIADAEDLDDDEPLILAENPFVGSERDSAIRLRPCVGDYFKLKLIDSGLMVDLCAKFIAFPWNNFFHNVVFDLVQQIFNGKLNLYNSFLIVELFSPSRCHLVEVIVLLYRNHNDDEFRPGYMGHLILIAEEVVKFTTLYKPDLISPVIVDAITLSDWEWFVNDVLLKTREVYNVVLGADGEGDGESDAEFALEEDKRNNVILLGDPSNHCEFVNDGADDKDDGLLGGDNDTDPQSDDEVKAEHDEMADDDEDSDEAHELRRVPRHHS